MTSSSGAPPIRLEPRHPRRAVVFCVGAGGNPERHEPLLRHLYAIDSLVIAPAFERIDSPEPTEEQLLHRVDTLTRAIESVPDTVELTLIGHSIGATLALTLAGAHAWLRSGRRLETQASPRVRRLALLAPPTGYFRAPAALAAVRAPMRAYAGSQDTITPAEQAHFLRTAAADPRLVDVRVVEGAGHFSFMHVLPPTVPELEGFDRQVFLQQLVAELAQFITN